MKSKINQIIDAIDSYRIDDNIGLLSGQCGVALFYFFCSTQINNAYKAKCLKRIEYVLDRINNENQINSFCTGISGFGWLLEFLKENKIFSSKDILLLNDLDNYLFKNMIAEFNNHCYDYLHGAIGYGLYFLKRLYKSNVPSYLSALVYHLEDLGENDSNGCIKWKSILDYEKDKRGYNISLSHGIASIIVILTKIYKSGIEKTKCKQLIIGAVKYILKQELVRNKYNSYFPSWSIESDERVTSSRLAWCYGDLGIAMAIWQVGQTLNISEWTEIALEILLYSTTRKDLKGNFVQDAGICHGTAGIGHLFYRMYWNTKRMEFKIGADYWFDETLKMANHKDGLAGFKTWHSEKLGGWANEINLINDLAAEQRGILGNLSYSPQAAGN